MVACGGSRAWRWQCGAFPLTPFLQLLGAESIQRGEDVVASNLQMSQKEAEEGRQELRDYSLIGEGVAEAVRALGGAPAG